MHGIDTSSAPPPMPGDRPWWKELTGYHWFVLVVAMLGWLFDTMDQQLFNLARAPAVAELTRGQQGGLDPKTVAGLTTMIFMIGWATGGLIFGVLGDLLGRVKTLIITILLYSAFTGLSALSVGIYDFCFYRFLTGLGVGGEFAVGVALVAETMPDKARAPALGWLQASSAIGNCMAAIISMILGEMQAQGSLLGWEAWRWMFVIGTGPALLILIIMARLREPEKWLEMKARRDAGDVPPGFVSLFTELFSDARWRKNAIVGFLLGFTGVVGLWGVGFFSFDLLRAVLKEHFSTENLAPEELNGKLAYWTGIASLLQNIGGFFGVLAFSVITQRIGRRPAFLLAFLAAMGATLLTFSSLKTFDDIYWMIPLLGFCQLTIFGGFAIYFPELFPTRLRSTGISFCYNIGRYFASVGPLTLGLLASNVYGQFGEVQSWRYAGMTMCSIFILGMVTLLFAPETKGKPLPE
ncbi:MFS transporter [Tuwongella immobilis]|uniref:Major facilitator superfamily (MFS) profile domain-containing protein n=1 Tax=Tuwongella immobilis TaxID=692036 RepID=A0A6C2YMK8_9BACT|nr:MFS transporter [Tuwongella immobilis]VIP02604.1 mfs transporter : Arabinose efflux permease family protein OS=Singulisphaera acidiphila (strain ATCC BAA-1392 / DSM 18658 / VKM B-2454 / MOB10) GN=Sinac_5304 PE=4 SV=1: Sugar_tr: MFS_1 [Tuwongella immobilis]VTS01900.1 mfs transporter : Arabinose efflux permease family protein OS=Singulisphaera acidiphila (strain ATCC BAA-1392 / DSM 18658 / VKM B-2454 / MOB10) GN=Sinac_5304 PE=4 SV=1: Sugar_tr: MFS_1 [Tuwongella immobilis]